MLEIHSQEETTLRARQAERNSKAFLVIIFSHFSL